MTLNLMSKIVSESDDLRRRIERLETAEGMSIKSKQAAAALLTSTFMGVPGLVGLWAQGFVNDAGDCTDISGNANDLTNTTDVDWTRGGTEIAPPNAYVDYGDAGGDYFLGKDATIYDIVGTEAWNAEAVRGITIGGWFDCQLDSTFQIVFGKWETTSATKAYHLAIQTDGDVSFSIYNAGAHTAVTAGQKMVKGSGWHFIAGRFDPSTELKVWRNRESRTNTVSIPATAASSTGRVAVGAAGDGSTPFGGRGGICFLSNQFLEDSYIEHLYDASRGYYRPTTEF